MEGLQLLGPVVGLADAVILGPCVIGHPTTEGEERPVVLGRGTVIRSYAVIYQGSTFGPRAHVGHGAVVREGNEIGAQVSIGSSVELAPGNRIGARSRLHSGCFVSSATIGADVFVGPRVVLTDDPHPPCPRYLDCVRGATVGDGASIGANVTLLPGIHVGAGALVGAGSVVASDVEAGTVVFGNPARFRGRRDELECQAGLFERAYAWLGRSPEIRH